MFDCDVLFQGVQTLEVHAVQGVFEILNFLEIQSYAWEIKVVF